MLLSKIYVFYITYKTSIKEEIFREVDLIMFGKLEPWICFNRKKRNFQSNKLTFTPFIIIITSGNSSSSILRLNTTQDYASLEKI